MLCEACQAIFSNKEPSFERVVPHHKTLASLQSAVASGCRICSTLRKATLANNHSEFDSRYHLSSPNDEENETNHLTLVVNVGPTTEFFKLVPTLRLDDPEVGLSII